MEEYYNMWSDKMEKKQVKLANVADKYDERLLNPKAYGGELSNGRKIASAGDMFNSKGEINAYSKQDVVYQQEHFSALQSKYQRTPNKTASFYSPEEKQRIIEAAMTGPDGFRKFGEAMIPLVIDRLDYEGFIRQVYRVHELAPGQINSYEKDVNVAAIVTNIDGQTIETIAKGNRVFPPEFAITANPRISIQEIAQRQYDIVDRTHDKTTFQIMLKEDRQGLRELYQSSTLENSQIDLSTTLDKTGLETLQLQVERHRLLVDKFLMNRAELGDFKKNVNSLDYDPVTSRDLLLTGIFGSIWGINIFVSAGVDEQGIENVSVPAGCVFAVTEGRYLGAMPIRINLSIFNADQFVNKQLEYGWLFAEIISQCVLNPRAIAVGTKTGTVLPAWLTA